MEKGDAVRYTFLIVRIPYVIHLDNGMALK